jgi:hypothetical protein
MQLAITLVLEVILQSCNCILIIFIDVSTKVIKPYCCVDKCGLSRQKQENNNKKGDCEILWRLLSNNTM